MAIAETTHTLEREWQAFRERLQATLHTPPSAEEQARRRTLAEKVLAFRDSLPSLAPDTIDRYIEDTRREAEERSLGA